MLLVWPSHPYEKGLGYATFCKNVYMITNWFFFCLSGCSFMTQQREFRPNKLCNIPTLTTWISRIYLPSPVNSIFLCLRKHTCNYHPYTCLNTTFALSYKNLSLVCKNELQIFSFLSKPWTFSNFTGVYWLFFQDIKIRYEVLYRRNVSGWQ